MDSRQRITRKNLIGDIDALMCELSGDVPVTAPEGTPASGSGIPAAREESRTRNSAGPDPNTGTTPAGYAILAATVILSWLPLAFMFALSLAAAR
jgi:hypothetical protein